jgi:hypothetical protein
VSAVPGFLKLAAGDKAQENHDYSYDEQDVDESPDGIGSNEPEQPEDEQNDSDCIKHGFTFR